MMKLPLLFVCLFWLAAPLARAQAPTPPPDPQIAPLPTNISYTKTYTYPPAAHEENLSEEAKALQQFKSRFPETGKLEVTKTGDVRKEIEHMTNGMELERWKNGQVSFMTSTSMPGQILVSAPGMTTGSAMPIGDAPDFVELGWVSQKAFQGQQTRQGATCFFYKAGGQQAWIDTSTRLPIYYESPQFKITYEYKAPGGQLKLPEKFVKKFEDVKKAWTGRSLH